MTLKQLEVFIAVADTQSFSKGGESVSLTQSTVSQHIRALEEELGVRLFDRSSSQVSLTEAGKIFYSHAVRIRNQCTEAREEVRRFQGLEQATLRLGASTIPAACLIPDLLGRFTTTWPGVRLELQQGDSREVIGLLLENLVELALVGGQYDEDAVSFKELLTDRIVLVGRPGDQKDGVLSIQQLQDLPLIVREQGSGTRQATDSALKKAGLDPRNLRVVAQLGSSEAVRRAVIGGAGYAFLSKIAVARELAEGTLVEIQVEGLAITRSFYLAWRSGRSFSPAAEAFMRMLNSPFPFG
jgi:DNA-binding transcriptional LysR family regulator